MNMKMNKSEHICKHTLHLVSSAHMTGTISIYFFLNIFYFLTSENGGFADNRFTQIMLQISRKWGRKERNHITEQKR